MFPEILAFLFTLSSPIIHLNYNENPYGCFPSVKVAVTKSLEEVGSYPDGLKEALKTKLASYHSISSNQILISNGLSSLLHVITEAFVKEGSKVIVADPTFEYMKIYAERHGGKVVQVPLKADYSHDLEAMLKAVDSSTKLIYICNPNNPTGSLTPRQDIEKFLSRLPKDVYVVIDEAYHHFAKGSSDYLSFIEKPLSDERVIVGRTFSKAYGLAGLRIGYVVSSPKTIELLNRHMDFDSCNAVSLSGALAALKDETTLNLTVKKILDSRSEFYNQANIRGLNYIPSYGNFVMLETKGRPVSKIIAHFKKHDILIGREFMKTHVRISLGTPSQMEKFWEIWDLLLFFK